MTLRIVIRPQAARDLDELADYLAREAGLEVALRFYDAADEALRHLADMPGNGDPAGLR